MRTLAGQALHDDIAEAIAPALRAIAASIGPDGRHVIYLTGSHIHAARTGSEIARHICSDHFAERLLKEALVDAERQFGDGTARLAVMAGAALAARFRSDGALIQNERLVDALDSLRPELDVAFAAETRVCDEMDELLVAGGVDGTLAPLIAEAFATAEADGLIEVREAATTAVTRAHGFVFDARQLGTGTLAAMDDVYMIVANEVLTDFKTLVPVIEGFATRGKALVIFARAIDGHALQLIERNRQAGSLKIAALVPTDPGSRAADILEDTAAACGATLICGRAGNSIEALKPAMLGRAERIHIEAGRVHLLGASGCSGPIALRIAAAEAEIRAKRYLPYDREHAVRRRARLLGRWAEIKIASGADSTIQVEAARRAIISARAGLAGGVIAGGGCGLEKIADRLKGTGGGDWARSAAAAMVDAALRAPGHCMRHNSMGFRAAENRLTSASIADPASLSRDLLDVALSLAIRLGGVGSAILRH